MSAYIIHLAQVHEIQPVQLSEPVFDGEGRKLCEKGTEFGAETAKLLREHTLSKPIEHCISLEQGFTAELVFGLILQNIQNDPSMLAIHEQCNVEASLINCLKHFQEHKILLQKLNVLAIQIPDVFDQSVFCAWMSLCALTLEGRPQAELNIAFLAALTHDFGLLEIDPEIIFKTGELDPAEWVAMQQHPILGARTLKNLCYDVDAVVIRAVAEHHETPDGTGYPKGKIGKQLGDMGRLLFLLDSVNAIYRKHFLPRGRTLYDVIPIIQMSTLSTSGPLGESVIKLMRIPQASEHCAIGENLIPDAITMIRSNAADIQEFSTLTEEFTRTVGLKHKNLGVFSLQSIAKMIRATVASCGIINDAYLRFLDQVQQENLDFAFRELEDVLLMTQEILFHVRRYQRHLDMFLIRETNEELKQHVETLRDAMEDSLKYSKAPETLAGYLKGQ